MHARIGRKVYTGSENCDIIKWRMTHVVDLLDFMHENAYMLSFRIEYDLSERYMYSNRQCSDVTGSCQSEKFMHQQ